MKAKALRCSVLSAAERSKASGRKLLSCILLTDIVAAVEANQATSLLLGVSGTDCRMELLREVGVGTEPDWGARLSAVPT